MRTQIPQEILSALVFPQHHPPQLARLLEILVRHLRRRRTYFANPLLVGRHLVAAVRQLRVARPHVIRVGAVIAVHAVWPVALVGRVDGAERRVAGDLLVVGPPCQSRAKGTTSAAR